MSFNFTLATLNIKGLGQKKNTREVFHWLRRYHNGIILMQETHCTKECQETWKRDWGGDIFFSNGTSNSRGVAVLLPNNTDYTIKKKTR